MPRFDLTEQTFAKRIYIPRTGPDVFIPEIPVSVDCMWAQPLRTIVTQDGDEFWQTMRVEPLKPKPKGQLHAYALRTAFEDIRKPSELAAFLAICGPFRERANEQRVTWPECVEWQKHIRARRQREKVLLPQTPNAPDRGALSDPVLDPDERLRPNGRPSRGLIVHASTTLEAICGTIQIDKIRGAEIGVCELQTCQRLFEFTTEHDKHFCSAEHARQEAKRLRNLKAKETGR